MLLQFFYTCIDLPFRLRNMFRRRISRITLFTTSEEKSDSQVTFYESAVSRIIGNKNSFKRFRRIYDYREILEHVNFRQGKEYLEIAKSKSPTSILNFESFKANDNYGKPRKFNYQGIGKVSPTTLRYVSVAMDLYEKFGSCKNFKVAEIGGGYGGQAHILSKMEGYQSFHIFDLPNVQILIDRFLTENSVENFHLETLHDLGFAEYDLVISNYAFSELPRNLQDQYLEKVILKSKRGYMIMNSGLRNETGRSDGKVTLEEIKELIPELKVHEEKPLTSSDNYLITWEK